ncbi:MAG: DUF2157 domain-containing protein [Chryseolinea sp.]
MSKHILRALPELVQAQVITEETAAQIRGYYNRQPNRASNRLFIIFGILGSLLIGMGIILILAHNWDTLPKGIKLAIGLLPLFVGQLLSGYLLWKKSSSTAWTEGAATFLFFAVAVSIAIVSQVYNIEGNLGSFVFLWMALALPIVYVLKSSIAALLFVCGMTWYACETGYFSYPHDSALFYWISLLLLVPFYYFEFIAKRLKNNFFYFHCWAIALSLTICLGLFAVDADELMMIAYLGLFCIYIMLGEMKTFHTHKVLGNAFLVVGSLGAIVLLLTLSFRFYWEELPKYTEKTIIGTQEFFVALVVTLIATALLVFNLRTRKFSEINAKSLAFLLLIGLFALGIHFPVLSQVLTNIVILLFAIHTIRSGARQDHLGILNYGLLIIAVLIICRFVDTNFSFVVRGLLFISVGAGFFAANYYLVKRRKGQA